CRDEVGGCSRHAVRENLQPLRERPDHTAIDVTKRVKDKILFVSRLRMVERGLGACNGSDQNLRLRPYLLEPNLNRGDRDSPVIETETQANVHPPRLREIPIPRPVIPDWSVRHPNSTFSPTMLQPDRQPRTYRQS